MATSGEQLRTDVTAQAGDWFERNRAGSLTPEENAEFFEWLRASPLHIREYLGVACVVEGIRRGKAGQVESLDHLLAECAALRDTAAAQSGPTASAAARVRRRQRARYLRLAASVVFVAAALLWWRHDGELLGIPKTYRTAHGEQLTQRLPDGSVLRLDTDSAATVRYSHRERLVVVDAGQALFEVAHGDKQRWFRVAAGQAGAVAVGTRFNVFRRNQATEFTVAEGVIAVYAGPAPAIAAGSAVPALDWRVTAGYRLRIDDQNPHGAQPVAVDLRQVLGWLQHQVVFEHLPLGEVAAEFSRYARTPIEVEDAQLAELPISGAFDANDTESFLAFVERLPGAKLERSEARIRVRKGATSN